MKNPLKGLCLALIRFYQRCISPYTPAHCRFYPTCSSYAFPGGYDPVPEEFHFFRGKSEPD